ncbi:transposable element Tcb1 transposase [Trichonephila clavipes]|uniref:Transposable element Tcb1 transposase n=1 Tax=Trichonephila clavipes TaxID=2585209 RepID=A0A8X7BFY9_TRICX|nr:transposable element Tcb1 transposase [Trichonephila clavipes]
MLPGEFDIAHGVVSRLWKSFKTTGMCSRRHGGGRVKVRRLQKTEIVLSAKKEQAYHSSADSTVLSVCNGVVSITIGLNRTGHAYYSQMKKYPGKGPISDMQFMWAGIMINGRTRLHVVANGTMTGQRYIDEVLLPHVRLFRVASVIILFLWTTTQRVRTLAVQDCLDSEGIQRLVWPARSPDLNPIENVWVAFGRQVAGRQNNPPTNKNALIRAVTEEWDKMPQQLLDNVVQSMVRRVECCITLHGGHIPY